MHAEEEEECWNKNSSIQEKKRGLEANHFRGIVPIQFGRLQCLCSLSVLPLPKSEYFMPSFQNKEVLSSLSFVFSDGF